jgi:hypothetical protein
MPNPNNPRLQLILDLQGEPVEPRHLEYMQARLAQMLGCEKMYRAFWVTRLDLAIDYRGRYGIPVPLDRRTAQDLCDEVRHEPTFDLYVDGGTVPLGRIINVKIPQWGS